MNSTFLHSYIKKAYWALPFTFFFLGYFFCHICFKKNSFSTPTLIGKTADQALTLLKNQQLNIRLLTQKENNNLTPGTILHQIPQPGSSIKPHQTIFLITSKVASKTIAPDLQNLFYTEIATLLKNKKISFKVYFLKSNQPDQLCIGQYPEKNTEIPNNEMIIYCAKNNNDLVLFPNLTHYCLEDTTDFLKAYNIIPEVFHTTTIAKNHTCFNCTIKEQKPSPGALISLKKSMLVQLKV